MEGVCGSGRDDDCAGYSHSVTCCRAHYNDGDDIYLTDADDCDWRFGDYGEEVSCSSGQAIFGRCGSGRDPDCEDFDGENFYHGALCCDIEKK